LPQFRFLRKSSDEVPRTFSEPRLISSKTGIGKPLRNNFITGLHVRRRPAFVAFDFGAQSRKSLAVELIVFSTTRIANVFFTPFLQRRRGHQHALIADQRLLARILLFGKRFGMRVDVLFSSFPSRSLLVKSNTKEISGARIGTPFREQFKTAQSWEGLNQELTSFRAR